MILIDRLMFCFVSCSNDTVNLSIRSLFFLLRSNKKVESVPDEYFLEGVALSTINLSKNLLKVAPQRYFLLFALSLAHFHCFLGRIHLTFYSK